MSLFTQSYFHLTYSTRQRATKLHSTPGDTRHRQAAGPGPPTGDEPPATPAGPFPHARTNLSGPRSGRAGQQRAVTSAEKQRRPSRSPPGPPRAPIASAPVPASATALQGNSRGAAVRGSQQTPHVTRAPVRRSFSPLQRALAAPGRREAAPPPDHGEREGERTTHPGMQAGGSPRSTPGRPALPRHAAGRGLAAPGRGVGCRRPRAASTRLPPGRRSHGRNKDQCLLPGSCPPVNQQVRWDERFAAGTAHSSLQSGVLFVPFYILQIISSFLRS